VNVPAMAPGGPWRTNTLAYCNRLPYDHGGHGWRAETMRTAYSHCRPDTTTPVVLLQGVPNPVQHGMLAAARSLGKLGIPVFAVFNQSRAACRRSKYLRGAATFDVRCAPPAQFIDVIRGLMGTAKAPLLIPTDDVAVLFVDGVAAIREHCLLPGQQTGVLRQLADKRQLLTLLHDLDIPAPASRVVSRREELQDEARKIPFPAVLKSADPLILRTTSGAASVTVAKTAAELMQAYDRMDPRAQANILLQEYIPGGNTVDWIFDACFDNASTCLFRGTGLKIRQLPLGTGAATLGVSLPNPAVEDLSLALATAVKYAGMIDIDYRYDHRDGRYKLLDVNPRLGASFRLFVADDGTDVLRAHYLDLTGQPVPQTRARDGRKWIVELRDLRSSLKLLRSGQLNARAWARSIAGVEEMAWFDPHDIAPFAAMLHHYAVRYLRGRTLEIQ